MDIGIDDLDFADE
jgi:FtsZ-binding cell division protein ZapB